MLAHSKRPKHGILDRTKAELRCHERVEAGNKALEAKGSGPEPKIRGQKCGANDAPSSALGGAREKETGQPREQPQDYVRYVRPEGLLWTARPAHAC